MNRETFCEKYAFSKNMDINDLRKLTMFLMICMLDISFNDRSKGEKTKVEEFLDDFKKFAGI